MKKQENHHTIAINFKTCQIQSEKYSSRKTDKAKRMFKLLKNLKWMLLVFKQEGGGDTKVDCHANYVNCDMFAVPIPFQIFTLSAV